MKCTICERFCMIPESKSGACGLYFNQGNEILERYPYRYLITTPISIETMPVLHFHPGSKFLQVSTAGCNFSCSGCISTVIVKEMKPDSKALRCLQPEEVIAMAGKQECLGISFLINDPLASFLTLELEVTMTEGYRNRSQGEGFARALLSRRGKYSPRP